MLPVRPAQKTRFAAAKFRYRWRGPSDQGDMNRAKNPCGTRLPLEDRPTADSLDREGFATRQAVTVQVSMVLPFHGKTAHVSRRRAPVRGQTGRSGPITLTSGNLTPPIAARINRRLREAGAAARGVQWSPIAPREDVFSLSPFAPRKDVFSLSPFAPRKDVFSLSPFAPRKDVFSLSSFAPRNVFSRSERQQ